ncbi:MAG: transposase [Phycicoccus sp.]|nr:transposase [Phycicoccus sp.]
MGSSQIRWEECDAPSEVRSAMSWVEVSRVLAYFDTDGLSNGGTEAINLIIEKTRRLAHGFRTLALYQLRILLAASGTRPWRLNHSPLGRSLQPGARARIRGSSCRAGAGSAPAYPTGQPCPVATPTETESMQKPGAALATLTVSMAVPDRTVKTNAPPPGAAVNAGESPDVSPRAPRRPATIWTSPVPSAW